MRKLKYLILAVGTLFVIASCDDNIPQSFNAEDSNASFSKTTASVNENATEPFFDFFISVSGHVPYVRGRFNRGRYESSH